MAKVFISYSIKCDYSIRLSAELFSLLTTAGHEPLLDRKCIYPDNYWRTEINHWLCECDAVIFLYSRSALEVSHWVKFETSVLAWRKALHPELAIVQVLLEGVMPSDLDSGFFSTTQLKEVQCISWNDISADDLAAKVMGYFPRQMSSRTTSQFDEWMNHVAGLLGSAFDQTKEHCATKLNVDFKKHLILPNPERALASQFLLAFQNRDKVIDALWELREGMNHEFFERLKSKILPQWVDPKAASEIPKITASNGRDRVAIINCEDVQFAEHYVWKGLGGEKKVHICYPTCITGFDSDELLFEFEQSIRRKLQFHEGNLKNHPSLVKCQIFLVVFGNAAFERPFLDKLHDLVPSATILVLVGLSGAIGHEIELSGIRVVEPLLDESKVESARHFISEIKSICIE